MHADTMKRILVWDLPVRIIHWALTALLAASLVLALGVDEDAPIFQVHMLCGLAAAWMVLLRIVWGFIGSRHARFRAFPVRPSRVAGYLKAVLSGGARRYAGHNPGSALAAMAMVLLVIGLAVTGLGWIGEAGEELHEALAYSLLAVIVAHLAGLVLHTVRHRDGIALSMVTGRKMGEPEEAIPGARAAWGWAVILAGFGWIAALFAAHDAPAATTRLPGIGRVVRLGEGPGPDGSRSASQRPHAKSRHHDDD